IPDSTALASNGRVPDGDFRRVPVRDGHQRRCDDDARLQSGRLCLHPAAPAALRASARGDGGTDQRQRAVPTESRSSKVNAMFLAVAAGVVLASPPIRSQGYPFSQRGSVTQSVAYTNISVVYGRPVARGRALFGAL